MKKLVDVATSLQPGRYPIDTSHSVVTFRIRHMFGLGTVRGRLGIRTGKLCIRAPLTDSSVYAEIDAASFLTGNEQRDRSVRSARLLDADRHPVMTFRADDLNGSSISGDLPGSTISGALTVRGVTRPIILLVDQSAVSSGSITARATTRVDRTDFGVTAYRGVAGRYLDVTMEIQCDLAGVAHV